MALRTQEVDLDTRQYIGIGINESGGWMGNIVSGFKETPEQVQQWAKITLGNQPKVQSVVILESIGICQRESSPVVYHSLPPMQEQLNKPVAVFDGVRGQEEPMSGTDLLAPRVKRFNSNASERTDY